MDEAFHAMAKEIKERVARQDLPAPAGSRRAVLHSQASLPFPLDLMLYYDYVYDYYYYTISFDFIGFSYLFKDLFLFQIKVDVFFSGPS